MHKLFFFTFFLISLVFTSCKKWQHKYPEDTERTKLTPEERLMNKWWVLQQVTLNNTDYTDSVKQTLGNYYIYFSASKYDNGLPGFDKYYGTISTDVEPSFTMIWNLSMDESSIGIGRLKGLLSSNIAPCYLKEGSYYKYLFEILKLNESEFKISIKTINGDSIITNSFIRN